MKKHFIGLNESFEVDATVLDLVSDEELKFKRLFMYIVKMKREHNAFVFSLESSITVKIVKLWLFKFLKKYPSS